MKQKKKNNKEVDITVSRENSQEIRQLCRTFVAAAGVSGFWASWCRRYGVGRLWPPVWLPILRITVWRTVVRRWWWHVACTDWRLVSRLLICTSSDWGFVTGLWVWRRFVEGRFMDSFFIWGIRRLIQRSCIWGIGFICRTCIWRIWGIVLLVAGFSIGRRIGGIKGRGFVCRFWVWVRLKWIFMWRITSVACLICRSGIRTGIVKGCLWSMRKGNICWCCCFSWGFFRGRFLSR